ncbi:helix-turn-helix transcriptional regulator [Streptosporangium amethystogenes subsp. fukuiense]|uniref:Helix-turn-helix transcriptional regulator n=1 Tax=Streptosporangium amethystogenes subsp. fukuiense TaxID=698418 RepID=A0ABW2SXM9_9ACTN
MNPQPPKNLWAGPLRLRELREAHGLTQEQLGELAEVDRKTINRIENGMYSPHLDKVFQIADALPIPVRHLFELPKVP